MMAELSERVESSLGMQEQYLNLHAGILVRAGSSLGAALARGNKLIALGCPIIARRVVAQINGRYSAQRPGLPAIALSENGPSVTGILNEYGRDEIYKRQLSAMAQPGDFVLGFLAGVDHAAQDGIDQARKLGLETLALEVPGAEEWMAT